MQACFHLCSVPQPDCLALQGKNLKPLGQIHHPRLLFCLVSFKRHPLIQQMKVVSRRSDLIVSHQEKLGRLSSEFEFSEVW